MMVTGLRFTAPPTACAAMRPPPRRSGQFGGEFAVTYRHAIGDFGHQIPHFMLEWRAGGMQRRHLIRAGAFAGEIGGQPFAGYTEYVGFTIGFAIRIENGLVIGGPPPVFKTEFGKSLAVGGHHHPADGPFRLWPASVVVASYRHYRALRDEAHTVPDSMKDGIVLYGQYCVLGSDI